MGCLALLSVTNFCEMEPSKSKNAVFSNYTRFECFFGWKGGRNFTEFLLQINVNFRQRQRTPITQ